MVEKVDETLETNVTFDLFVEVGPQDNRDTLYSKLLSKPINQNITSYNIDSECNYNKIWQDKTTKAIFQRTFDESCLNKNECTLKPENLSVYYMISPFCRDRINYLNITSYDFITVVGCTKDTVTVPLIDLTFSKEKIAVGVVAFDLFSVIIMSFIFFKLILINEKYLKIIDNLNIQMKDFGIKINDLKLDKYT